jgi:hypothetical protein
VGAISSRYSCPWARSRATRSVRMPLATKTCVRPGAAQAAAGASGAACGPRAWRSRPRARRNVCRACASAMLLRALVAVHVGGRRGVGAMSLNAGLRRHPLDSATTLPRCGLDRLPLVEAIAQKMHSPWQRLWVITEKRTVSQGLHLRGRLRADAFRASRNRAEAIDLLVDSGRAGDSARASVRRGAGRAVFPSRDPSSRRRRGTSRVPGAVATMSRRSDSSASSGFSLAIRQMPRDRRFLRRRTGAAPVPRRSASHAYASRSASRRTGGPADLVVPPVVFVVGDRERGFDSYEDDRSRSLERCDGPV